MPSTAVAERLGASSDAVGVRHLASATGRGGGGRGRSCQLRGVIPCDVGDPESLLSGREPCVPKLLLVGGQQGLLDRRLRLCERVRLLLLEVLSLVRLPVGLDLHITHRRILGYGSSRTLCVWQQPSSRRRR